MTPRHGRLVAVVLALLAAVAVPLPATFAAPAQSPPEAAEPVLAIVSPLVSPVCAVSGSATLLVPILGGVVQDQLDLGGAISVGDVVLDALGPVYLACGSLPATAGQRCQLDRDLGMLWPEQGASVPPPLVAGGVVDSIDAALAALGLPPQAALDDALVCDVAPSAGAPTPPPPAALAPARVPVPTPSGAPAPLSQGVSPSAPATPLRSSPPAGVPTAPATPPSSPPPATLLQAVSNRLPDSVIALQLLVAVLLGLFLLGSWTSSWRATREPRT